MLLEGRDRVLICLYSQCLEGVGWPTIPFCPGLTGASLVAQMVKCLPAMQETWVWFLGREDPWRRKWQSIPALLPGKSHGQRSLIGYSPWGHKESDTTERLHFHFHLGGSLIFSAKTEKSWANWDELDTQVSAYSICSINASWENHLCSRNSDFQPPDCENFSIIVSHPVGDYAVLAN